MDRILTQSIIFRLMETNKYYVVEEDVSDEEDIDTKQYESPGYQR